MEREGDKYVQCRIMQCENTIMSCGERIKKRLGEGAEGRGKNL